MFSYIEKEIDDVGVIFEAMKVADTFGTLHVYEFKDDYFSLKAKVQELKEGNF